MLQFNNGTYHIGGVSVKDLCDKYDSPLYVYDTDTMEAQYNKLKNAFGDNTTIKFACKALNNINVLKFFKNIGCTTFR